MDPVFLGLNQLKSGFLLDRVSNFLPSVRATNILEIRKVEFNLEVEFSVQVVLLNIDLSSEEYDVVNLHLLFAVPDEESLRAEGTLRVDDSRG